MLLSDDTAAALWAANPGLEPFHAAAEAGHLLIRRCTACGKAHWYPRPHCPFCPGTTAWEPASGRGRIYSFAVTGKPPQRRAIAYVTLDEGPMLLTHIVGADPHALAIGQEVAVAFEPAGGSLRLPVFAPLHSHQDTSS
ncbi:Zn-ribbon domain-containing OB-fold protein [Paracidovorax cattleyae]|uniref:ChsH2 C-terminal OB-fold domain-containing protein n=1 Tax=Paracidovorax cattleyae TaxID=80868 RepID=A0A1H0WA77_9BURK|nr:OB-fold domain-containing protein [Paracidovorax cattleyae]SDP87528.1 hypothetical protein SAMN04489708_1355 [Paracidovorax cattleyae]